MDNAANISRDDLERIVDSVGLAKTLEMLAEVCWEKAEHLRVNWQDHVSDKAWDRDGKRLDTLSAKIEAS